MQALDVISINLWDVLVSLLNLLILFLIIKKFLYAPVKKMLKNRQNTIDSVYEQASAAKNEALEEKALYEEKLENADKEAERVIGSAVIAAKGREKEIISKAVIEADIIVERAKEEAELEMKKAEESIKEEIVSVSTLLAEKMLRREINKDDHSELIDSFLEEMGEKK